MASLPRKRSNSWRTDSTRTKQNWRRVVCGRGKKGNASGQPGLGFLGYIHIPQLWNGSSLISAKLIFSRPRKVYVTFNLIDPVIGIEARHIVNPVALRCTWGRGFIVNNGHMQRYDEEAKYFLLLKVQSAEKTHLFIHSRCLSISLLPSSVSALIWNVARTDKNKCI